MSVYETGFGVKCAPPHPVPWTAPVDNMFSYRLTGRRVLECGADGGWSGLVPDCLAVTCPAPPAPPHATMLPAPASQPSYRVGASVRFTCREGRVLVGEPITTCTHRATWSVQNKTNKCR